MFNNPIVLITLYGLCGVMFLVMAFASCGDKSEEHHVADEEFGLQVYDTELNKRITEGLAGAFSAWSDVYNERKHPTGALAYMQALRAFYELRVEMKWDYPEAELRWKEFRVVAMKPYMDADPTASSSKAQHIHNAEIIYFGVVP